MKRRWPILTILLISLAVRLAWGLSQPAEPGAELPDQKEYLAIARHLVIGQGLRFRDDRFGSDEVVAFRAPGYPAFIAMMGAEPIWVRVGQAILDTSTVLAIYLLARRWLDERSAWVAAILVGLNPYLIFFTGVVLSETLFTAALAWGISLLGRKLYYSTHRDSGESAGSTDPLKRGDRFITLKLGIAGALCLAVAVIVRPSAVMLVPLACAIAAWPSALRVLAWAIFGVVVAGLTLYPWANRNHEMLDEWIWSTTNTGQTTWDGFQPFATGASDLAELPKMRELKGLSETARNHLLARLGREYMTKDVPRAVRLGMRKVARTWSPMPLSDEYASTRNKIVGLAYGVPLFLLTLVGLFRRAIPGSLKTLCLLPAVYFTAGAAITVGSLRYRLPAEPPMILLAASVFKRNTSSEISRVLK